MKTEEKCGIVVSKYSYVGVGQLNGGSVFSDLPHERLVNYVIVLDNHDELCVSESEYSSGYCIGEKVTYETFVWEKSDYWTLFFFVLIALFLIVAIVILL